MIIDSDAGVTPTRFVDRDLRRHIGYLIGKATRDDMLRAFLWVSECQIAQEICKAWEAHLGALEREVEEAERRSADTASPSYLWTADSRDAITKACHTRSSALLKQLRSECDEAGQAHRECTRVLFELSARLGLPMKSHVPVPDRSGAPLLDALAPLRKQLAAARSRLTVLVTQDREELHDLASQEDYRRQSAESASSVPLNAIDSMGASEFASLLERLLQRDGFQTARPDGVGEELLVSATCPEGHTVIISTHRVKGPTWSEAAALIGIPELHSARLVAGRHGSDVFVVVTNGGFSKPAERYATEHGMDLIGRRGLQRWAEWEEPVVCDEDLEQDVA